MTRSNAHAAVKTHRAPAPPLARKTRISGEPAPSSAARLRLVAIGAAPASSQNASKAKERPLSPHISVGQFLRAAVVVFAACMAVAFPPPGLEKQSASTSISSGR